MIASTANRILYQWQTDCYGNHYGLYKTKRDSIYQNYFDLGNLWYRDQAGKVQYSQIALSGVNSFKTVNASGNNLSGDNIRNFNIYYDTMVTETSSHVYIDKLDFDYDTNKVTSIADNSFSVILSTDQGGFFADSWLHEDTKELTLCVAYSGTSPQYVYPELYSLDINNNKFTKVFPISSVDQTILQSTLSAYAFDYIERPVFSYNDLTKTYNMSFLGFTSTYVDSFIVVSIDLTPGDKITVQNVHTIIPSNYVQ